MNEFSNKVNEIAIIEYMYQFNVAKCIKSGKLNDEELKEKVKDFMNTKEKMIKEIYD